MTEGVCKNEVAAGVGKLLSSRKALVILGDVGLDENLVVFKTESLLSILESLDEVVVIGGVFIVKADKTYLDL